jgi:hypothetical protein
VHMFFVQLRIASNLTAVSIDNIYDACKSDATKATALANLLTQAINKIENRVNHANSKFY